MKAVFTNNDIMTRNLEENNMYYRKGDIVTVAEAQDDEHEEFLKNFRGKNFCVAVVNKESETYQLSPLETYKCYQSDSLYWEQQGLDLVTVGSRTISNGIEIENDICIANFVDTDLKPLKPINSDVQ